MIIRKTISIQETIVADGHREPCNPVTRLAAVGTSIDIPLGHKDAVWSFDHFDSMTIMVADAPRPDEIVLCMAVAGGGRPHPCVGNGPIAD